MRKYFISTIRRSVVPTVQIVPRRSVTNKTSFGVSYEDLQHDLAWLQFYYNHKDYHNLMAFYEKVIYNPFFAECHHMWDHALVGLIACAWHKMPGPESTTLPGYYDVKGKKAPKTIRLGEVYVRIEYLTRFLNRNARAGNITDPNEQFPYYWNLDLKISRLCQYFNGFFFCTGSYEALEKLVACYEKWLQYTRDPNNFQAKDPETEIVLALRANIIFILEKHEIAADHINDIVLKSQNISDETKFHVKEAYNKCVNSGRIAKERSNLL